ncbi:DUF3352 domain-containing protein [Luteococcus peritonei]|uniref:DUF3352 domain-containing protein n=1 Tax=Luteococcus peritonei TaxID=88874 RepID=A0ABW4RU71_9ACTN
MSSTPPDAYLPPEQPVAPAGGATTIEPTPRRLGTGAKAGIVGLALLALGGGFALADPMDLREDKGAQGPAAVLPADALGYAAVNLDPSVGQKLEMVRFAMKFPALKQKISLSEDGDLKQQFWEAAMKDSSCKDKIDYEADIKPWLGDHAGVALQKDDDKLVMAVEASDEAKARAAVEKLDACDSSGSTTKEGVAYRDGYLLLGKDQPTVDAAVASATSAPLSQRAEFTEDLDKLGSTGVMSFWTSKEGLVAASQESSQAAQNGVDGTELEQMPVRSAAGTLRFTDGNPELHFASKSTEPVPVSEKGSDLGSLPGETTVALGLANGADLVEQNWPEIRKMIESQGTSLADLERDSKLKLPDDLKTLLGSDLRISLGPVTPESMEDPSTLPVAVATTTDKAKLTELLDRVGASQQGISLTSQGESQVLGINTSWPQKVAETGSKLADDAAFTKAVDAPEKAQTAGYVNLAQLVDSLGAELSADEKENLAPLQSVGLSSHQEEGDYSVGTLRLTTR